MNRLRMLASLPLGAFGYLSLLSTAHAGPACATDADCQAGYVCNVTSLSGCAVLPCSRDEECPPRPPCAVTVIRQCSPGAKCATDADCSPELRCQSNTMTTCTGSAPRCPRGEACAPPPPAECVTSTTSTCRPRYGSACAADAECGAGLQCVHSQTCTCIDIGDGNSGGTGGSIVVGPSPDARSVPGASGAPNAGGSATPSEKPTSDAAGKSDDATGTSPVSCSCANDGPLVCDLVKRDCVQASDCPVGWACEGSAVGCAVSVDPDGGVGTCPALEMPNQCVSPFGWSVPVRNGGTDDSLGASGGASGSGGSTGSQTGGTTKTGGEVVNAGPGSTPPTQPTSPSAGKGGESNSSRGHTPSGPIELGGGISCQVGSASSGVAGAAWFAVVGLATLVTRRRRRA